MAKLNILVAMLLVGVALEYASMPVFAVEGDEPKQFWDQCLTKLTPKCALDIVEGIFGTEAMPDSCCPELILEGKPCYDTLINYMAGRPIYAARASEFLKKKDDLWIHCASVPSIV